MNEKQVTKQKALDYCMYMIVASYFAEITLKSPIQEKNLLLHYKDLKPQEQIDLEEQCIRYMQKVEKKIPEEIWEQPMEVHLVGKPRKASTELSFVSEPYVIEIRTDYGKGKADIKFVLWRKRR
ncbi:MAG: hypothetical protein IJX63_00800 [Lachnospiraceae bacterium]|nr:hypothetical protein [Lachnospiraceae bacterium]